MARRVCSRCLSEHPGDWTLEVSVNGDLHRLALCERRFRELNDELRYVILRHAEIVHEPDSLRPWREPALSAPVRLRPPPPPPAADLAAEPATAAVAVVDRLPPAAEVWELTEHAEQQRCGERGITPDDARWAAYDPDLCLPREHYPGQELRIRGTVAVVVDPAEKRIVTVFPRVDTPVRRSG